VPRASFRARTSRATGRAGWSASATAYARRSVRLRVLLTGQSLALICFTLVVPIEVIYAKESLQTSSAGFGVLLAAWGAGILLGSLLFLSLRNRSGFGLLLVSSGAVGLAYLGMASAQSLLVACLMSIVGGAGNGVQWIAVMTALQESTPPEYQARVSGLLESIGAAMPGVGFFAGGVIVELTSPRTAYTIAGAGVIALVLAAACLKPAYQRGVRPEAVALTPRRRPAAPSDGA
jgi:MFS family permease